MDKINLRNMPYGELFKYAENYYVWKIMRANGTREANYLSSEPTLSLFTEVFRVDNDSNLVAVWSGRLATNPGLYNEEGLDSAGNFSIFSYDQDTSANFHQAQDLEMAPIELQISALQSEIDVLKRIDDELKARNNRNI